MSEADTAAVVLSPSTTDTNLVSAPKTKMSWWTRRIATPLGALQELASLLIKNGRWWLVPMVGVMILLAAILVVVQALEYVAPFVYTIF